MTEKEQIKNLSNVEYEIELRSDGISCVRTTVQSEVEAISFSRTSARLLDAIALGQIINQLETYCGLVDGNLIMEKREGIPDDLRLAVTTAVRYPEGLSDEIVQEKLEIKADSRKAYINSPLKRTSKYLSYNKKTKSIHIDTEGIRWALSEIQSKEASGSHKPAKDGEKKNIEQV